MASPMNINKKNNGPVPMNINKKPREKKKKNRPVPMNINKGDRVVYVRAHTRIIKSK